MTAETNTPVSPVAEAVRLLRDNAEGIKCCVSVAGVPMWSDDQDSKQLYDEHIAAADALERWAGLPDGVILTRASDLIPRPPTDPTGAAIRLKLVRGAFGSGIGLHIRQWDNLGGLGVGTHVLFKKTAPGDAS